MKPSELLAAYEGQIRKRPEAGGSSTVVERADGVVRVVDGDDGWVGVTFSQLSGASADEVIAAQVD
ncbi:MAG: hypothetical protein ACRYG2_32970, partial [Janthinobacterium lividum]